MRHELRERQERVLPRFTPRERRALAGRLHRLAEVVSEAPTERGEA
ncbi:MULTISPECIES: hypothetical protein [unclassified Streptomyces]